MKHFFAKTFTIGLRKSGLRNGIQVEAPIKIIVQFFCDGIRDEIACAEELVTAYNDRIQLV